MVNFDRPRLQFDGLAVPRQIIGALALDLDGGILRRRLLDQAGELRQQVPDRIGRRPGIAGLGDPALGIVGVAFLAPAHRKAIALAAVHHERNRLGGLAQGDRQAPGGEWIERAPMAARLWSATQPWTSRLARRGWLFWRGCLPARPCCSLPPCGEGSGRGLDRDGSSPCIPLSRRCCAAPTSPTGGEVTETLAPFSSSKFLFPAPEIFFSAPSESPFGGSIRLFAAVTIIRLLFRILRIWCEVFLHRRCSQNFFFSSAFYN